MLKITASFIELITSKIKQEGCTEWISGRLNVEKNIKIKDETIISTGGKISAVVTLIPTK